MSRVIVQSLSAALQKTLISVLNAEFPCERNWSEKGEFVQEDYIIF